MVQVQSYPGRLKPFARSLRNNQTDAEQCLWRRLRRNQIVGIRFYRQRPILDYVVDFYCPAARLVIELDGSQHFEAQGQAHDRRRTKRLEASGLRLLRFDDRQALKETSAVLEVIRRVVVERVKEKNPPPAPPSRLRRQRGG
jgi:very-short-patch-repair endonuclease